MLFLEQDVDRSLGSRQDRWWAAYAGSSPYLPLIMADSGHRISSGFVDFYNVYKGMVDAELTRAPGAEIEAVSARVGERLRLSGWITNRSNVILSFARNCATIHGIVYEDVSGGSTGRIVRAAVSQRLSSDVADGSSVEFSMETPDLSGVNWQNIHSVVMADYRPGGTLGAYDMLQAATPFTAASDAATTALFAQVAIGGGYTTTFTLTNTGDSTLTGQLILTDKNGNPWVTSLSESGAGPKDAGVAERAAATAPYTAMTIPPGGTQFITASPASPGTGLMTGWARVDSSGGTLGAVATYSYTPSDALQTVVGVLSGTLLTAATIPRDDDPGAERYTGFAAANPGDSPITIQVYEVSADGATITSLTPLALAPRSQKAGFFIEDANATQKWKGSAVLVGQNGAVFTAVALVQNRGMYTAIPVMPGATPKVPR